MPVHDDRRIICDGLPIIRAGLHADDPAIIARLRCRLAGTMPDHAPDRPAIVAPNNAAMIRSAERYC
jgi:hypothetical protein